MAIDFDRNTSEASPCFELSVARTDLSADVAAGSTTLTVDPLGAANPSSVLIELGPVIYPGDQAQIGTGPTQETRTITEVQAAPQGGLGTLGTGFTLTLDAPLDHAHSAGESVVFIGGGGSGEDVTWGDGDCNDTWSTADILALLRQQVGISPAGNGACPEIGTPVEQGGQSLTWGDWDGDGTVSAADIVPLLRHQANLPDETELWLPPPGTQTRLLWAS